MKYMRLEKMVRYREVNGARTCTYFDPFSTASFTEVLEAAVFFPDLNLRL